MSSFSLPPILRPTFKTATPTSRTQLKQQLQREQQQELERQELERRENERKLLLLNNHSHTVGGLSSLNQSQSHTHLPQYSQQQLPIPCDNYESSSSMCLTSSPTPSTSTNGSDFSTSQFTNNPSAQHSQQSSAPLKVPLHIGVDLPPQVLKVSFISNSSTVFFLVVVQIIKILCCCLFFSRFERC